MEIRWKIQAEMSLHCWGIACSFQCQVDRCSYSLRMGLFWMHNRRLHHTEKCRPFWCNRLCYVISIERGKSALAERERDSLIRMDHPLLDDDMGLMPYPLWKLYE